jgi:hypothetical protein
MAEQECGKWWVWIGPGGESKIQFGHVVKDPAPTYLGVDPARVDALQLKLDEANKYIESLKEVVTKATADKFVAETAYDLACQEIETLREVLNLVNQVGVAAVAMRDNCIGPVEEFDKAMVALGMWILAHPEEQDVVLEA